MSKNRTNQAISIVDKLQGHTFTGRQIQALSRASDGKAANVFAAIVEYCHGVCGEMYSGFAGQNAPDPKFLSKPEIAARLAKTPAKFTGDIADLINVAYGPKLVQHEQIIRFGGIVSEKPLHAPMHDSVAVTVSDLDFLNDLEI